MREEPYIILSGRPIGKIPDGMTQIGKVTVLDLRTRVIKKMRYRRDSKTPNNLELFPKKYI